ncbi:MULTISPECIES: hypothetical protein [unclassified Mesorhizobium]|uniref:hypothetical protein n=1 Tax=unclassified Mesorhizobium TaxID=325217 RepID=UPI002415AAFF|nr:MULTISPECIES: hypothetical protein [unclassified Mesorhizobium]MDG4902786.1 hypothetical protein [Mesorhizobium sp. WSM4962]MDG4920795.1 hypothetical protein [Mesorhizobium sp. WSM4989]
MTKKSISAMDIDIIRSALQAAIYENKLPESEWREQAIKLIQVFTGSNTAVDQELLDWIVRK